MRGKLGAAGLAACGRRGGGAVAATGLANAEEHLSALVNGTLPERGRRGFGPGFGAPPPAAA
jgi:hypothetical protein